MPNPFQAEIDQGAALLESLALWETCDIARKGTPTRDDTGGVVDTWPEVRTGVPCAFSASLGRQETRTAERMDIAVDGQVTLPAGTDVRNEDRIVDLTFRGVRYGDFDVVAVIPRYVKTVALVTKVQE